MAIAFIGLGILAGLMAACMVTANGLNRVRILFGALFAFLGFVILWGISLFSAEEMFLRMPEIMIPVVVMEVAYWVGILFFLWRDAEHRAKEISLPHAVSASIRDHDLETAVKEVQSALQQFDYWHARLKAHREGYLREPYHMNTVESAIGVIQCLHGMTFDAMRPLNELLQRHKALPVVVKGYMPSCFKDFRLFTLKNRQPRHNE